MVMVVVTLKVNKITLSDKSCAVVKKWSFPLCKCKNADVCQVLNHLTPKIYKQSLLFTAQFLWKCFIVFKHSFVLLASVKL